MNLEFFRPTISITFRVHKGAYRKHSSFAPAEGGIVVIRSGVYCRYNYIMQKGIGTYCQSLKKLKTLILIHEI